MRIHVSSSRFRSFAKNYYQWPLLVNSSQTQGHSASLRSALAPGYLIPRPRPLPALPFG